MEPCDYVLAAEMWAQGWVRSLGSALQGKGLPLLSPLIPSALGGMECGGEPPRVNPYPLVAS